jgi:hypothetical protein
MFLIEPFFVSCLCGLPNTWFVGIGADYRTISNPGMNAFASEATVASAKPAVTH